MPLNVMQQTDCGSTGLRESVLSVIYVTEM